MPMKNIQKFYVATLSLVAFVSTTQAQNDASDRYIVGLKRGVRADQVAARHGVTIETSYSVALNGFAGKVPPGRLRALQRDGAVAFVEVDQVLSIINKPTPSPETVVTTGEILPTGVARVDADLNSVLDASSTAVAIIDTGISSGHPDLNIAGGVSYVRGSKSWNDDNGHGSHCAGIVAAKADGNGVRGVAPNARLYAVKVLDRNGSGYLSWIISGIDWVARNANSRGIKVANLSLGMEGTSSALTTSLDNLLAAGVTPVVAAGNSARDAAAFIPASHPNVISVSAIVDTDGQCGGTGPVTGYGGDDTFASFSNFGSVVDIAAPGVNIYSTYANKGYATLSGTSMAAPHVAGAAALYLVRNPTASTAAVRSAILNAATPQFNGCGSDGTRTIGGFTGDRDTSPEPLLDARNL